MKKKSPNLEVVSPPKASREEVTAERRRRFRLNLGAEQFRLRANGKIFSIVDLSVEGMALRILDSEDLKILPVATWIEGTLKFRDAKHLVRAQVRHVRSDMVGCQFEGLDPAVKLELERFLDPTALGKEIRPIPSSEAGTLWYHGSSGTDLVFWRGVDGQYKKLTLYVLGNFIQWAEDEGLATGIARAGKEESEVRGVVRLETLYLDRDAKPDPDKLRIAKDLIMSSNLPQDLKRWSVRHFLPS